MLNALRIELVLIERPLKICIWVRDQMADKTVKYGNMEKQTTGSDLSFLAYFIVLLYRN